MAKVVACTGLAAKALPLLPILPAEKPPQRQLDLRRLLLSFLNV